MSGRELVGWAVLAVAVVGLGVALAVVLHRRRRQRRRPPTPIDLPPRPPRRGDVAEHNLTALQQPGSDVDTAPAAAVVATPELFPGVADTHLLTECPTVDAPGGPIPLREWLRYDANVDPWPVVVSRFYTRAAADPQIAGYFTGVDMERLQRHFLAALMIVTGHGVTVGVVRRMQAAHASVRNPSGKPITEATWNAVIGVLAGVLGELGTPPATLVALATTIAPIRAAIVSEPGIPVR